MKFTITLAISVALAGTAQACVRILVNEVWGDTREITLWDQDQVSDLRLPFKETTSNDDIWQGSGYTVTINKQSTGGSVTYPNGHSGGLSRQARKQSTTSDGRTQVYYCLWDSYDCGNYACGLP